MNTLDPGFAQAATVKKQGLNYEIKKTKNTTLDNIISRTKYDKTKIDLRGGPGKLDTVFSG